MKRKYLPIYFLMLCMTIFNMTSCDQNDKVNLDDKEEYRPDNTSDAGLTREDSINIAIQLISNVLLDNDTVTVTTQDTPSIQRNVDYGQLLYESTPSARYRIAQDYADAKTIFMADFGWIMRFAGISADSDTITIDLGSKGELTFRPESGNGKVAVIDIDMTLIPDLTQIIFLSPQAWPQNNKDGGVRLYDTFKKDDGTRWVCVRTCDGGSEYGLLVTFDDDRDRVIAYFDPACNNEYKVDPYNEKDDKYAGWRFTHYLNDYDWQCYVHGSEYAKSEELKILNRFLYDQDDGQKSEAAQKILGNRRFMSEELYNHVFAYGAYYLCGDNSWHYTPKKPHTYQIYVYSQKKWKDSTVDFQYVFMGNRWYVMYPNVYNSLMYDDFYNSYACFNGNYHILNSDWVDITPNDKKKKGIPYWHTRNHDQKYDKKYVAVRAYRFYGDFGKINIEGDKLEYKDGFKPFILN